ncbi:MAG: hypothetical protein NTY99_00950 [DPANN group archaeon]|nr:hypothetical protein [DPANN group archaeon]
MTDATKFQQLRAQLGALLQSVLAYEARAPTPQELNAEEQYMAQDLAGIQRWLAYLRQTVNHPDTTQEQILRGEAGALITSLEGLAQRHNTHGIAARAMAIVTELRQMIAVPVTGAAVSGQTVQTQLNEAFTLAGEVEAFLAREFKDFTKERTDIKVIRKRYSGLNQETKNALGPLNGEEERLYPILQSIQSEVLNAIADIKWIKQRPNLPEPEKRARVINAISYVNTAKSQFEQISAIDHNMFVQTTHLKVTHASSVGDLTRLEQDVANFTQKMSQLLLQLNSILNRLLTELH